MSSAAVWTVMGCSSRCALVVQPVIAVLSRSRLMTCSRRASQSSPIIPTPASGWIVTSHPVQR